MWGIGFDIKIGCGDVIGIGICGCTCDGIGIGICIGVGICTWNGIGLDIGIKYVDTQMLRCCNGHHFKHRKR